MAHILVVDDDMSVRGFTARALKLDGHQVDEAEDGDLALECIAEREGSYDLVLSDIRMPSMDGIEMAKNAAEDYPDIRILLMTGYAEQRERCHDLAQIIIDVVPKPFTLTDIRDAVGKALAA